MSTIISIKRIYHTVNPNEKRMGDYVKKMLAEERREPPIQRMKNKALKNNFCEPWYGCQRCTCLCPWGREYLRREAAGEWDWSAM